MLQRQRRKLEHLELDGGRLFKIRLICGMIKGVVLISLGLSLMVQPSSEPEEAPHIFNEVPFLLNLPDSVSVVCD